jgi:hypothetical protein
MDERFVLDSVPKHSRFALWTSDSTAIEEKAAKPKQRSNHHQGRKDCGRCSRCEGRNEHQNGPEDLDYESSVQARCLPSRPDKADKKHFLPRTLEHATRVDKSGVDRRTYADSNFVSGTDRNRSTDRDRDGCRDT